MALAITEFSSRDTLMRAAACRLADTLIDAIAKYGEGCAALSGGSTPEPAYRALSLMPVDWELIMFALVDERFVPFSHPASNERMIETALSPAIGAGAHLLSVHSATASLEKAADIADALYAPLRIDVALMGMGADGHTASWFPAADKLGEALDLDNPRTMMALRAAHADGSPERLTLTRAALTRAGRIILLVTGAEKRARLEAALQGDWAPVAALFAPSMPEPEVLWAA